MKWVRWFSLLLSVGLAYAAIPQKEKSSNIAKSFDEDHVTAEENAHQSKKGGKLPLFVDDNVREECVVSCPSCPKCPHLSCPNRIPPGYMQYAGYGYYAYYKLNTIPETWYRAQEVCSQDGGHLAILNSRAEAELVVRLNAKLGSYLHIGMHDLVYQGNFTTLFGETLEEAGYSDWGDGQPGTKSDRCGCIKASNGRLHNIDCTKTALFVCEVKLI